MGAIAARGRATMATARSALISQVEAGVEAGAGAVQGERQMWRRKRQACRRPTAAEAKAEAIAGTRAAATRAGGVRAAATALTATATVIAGIETPGI